MAVINRKSESNNAIEDNIYSDSLSLTTVMEIFHF